MEVFCFSVVRSFSQWFLDIFSFYFNVCIFCVRLLLLFPMFLFFIEILVGRSLFLSKNWLRYTISSQHIVQVDKREKERLEKTRSECVYTYVWNVMFEGYGQISHKVDMRLDRLLKNYIFYGFGWCVICLVKSCVFSLFRCSRLLLLLLHLNHSIWFVLFLPRVLSTIPIILSLLKKSFACVQFVLGLSRVCVHKHK